MPTRAVVGLVFVVVAGTARGGHTCCSGHPPRRLILSAHREATPEADVGRGGGRAASFGSYTRCITPAWLACAAYGPHPVYVPASAGTYLYEHLRGLTWSKEWQCGTGVTKGASL
jgi:hypothetical protein